MGTCGLGPSLHTAPRVKRTFYSMEVRFVGNPVRRGTSALAVCSHHLGMKLSVEWKKKKKKERERMSLLIKAHLQL